MPCFGVVCPKLLFIGQLQESSLVQSDGETPVGSCCLQNLPQNPGHAACGNLGPMGRYVAGSKERRRGWCEHSLLHWAGASRPRWLSVQPITNEHVGLLPAILTIAPQSRSEEEGESRNEPQLSGGDTRTSTEGGGGQQVEGKWRGRGQFEEKT